MKGTGSQKIKAHQCATNIVIRFFLGPQPVTKLMLTGFIYRLYIQRYITEFCPTI